MMLGPRGLCIAIYDEDFRRLRRQLRYQVPSILADLKARGQRSYFDLDWLGGPQVVLETVGSATQEDLEKWLGEALAPEYRPPDARYVSAASLEDEAERRAATLESRRGSAVSYPPGTWLVRESEDRTHVFPSPAAANVFTHYLAHTSDATWRLALELEAPGGLAHYGLGLIASTVHRLTDGGIAKGFVSLRSHAESYLAEPDVPSAVRNLWEEHYLASQSVVGRVIQGAIDGSRFPHAAVIPHVESLVFFHDKILKLGNAELGIGYYKSAVDVAEDTRHRMAAIAEGRGFHQAMVEREDILWDLVNSREFTAFRFTLNALYRDLYRMGLTARSRFQLCYMAARFVEDHHGVDALEVIDAMGRRREE